MAHKPHDTDPRVIMKYRVVLHQTEEEGLANIRDTIREYLEAVASEFRE
jgi:hypothetical protein